MRYMMKVILVDDESLAIKRLERLLMVFEDVEIIKTFTNALEALAYLKVNECDVVFLDISMPEISGLDIAKVLYENGRLCAKVFITAHSDFALDAFDVEASDYLVKPIRKERLMQTIEKLRKITENSIGTSQKRIQIQSFGSISVQIVESNSKAVDIRWRTTKTKELFALLLNSANTFLHRTIIIENLWQEFDLKRSNTNLSTNLHYLKKELKLHGFESILRVEQKKVGLFLEPHMIDVDFNVFNNFVSKMKLDKDDIEKIFDIYNGNYYGEENYIWCYPKQMMIENQMCALVDRLLELDPNDLVQQRKILTHTVHVLPHKEKYYKRLIENLKVQGENELADKYYENLTKSTSDD